MTTSHLSPANHLDDVVVQFSAQVERFVGSPHANATESLVRLRAAVAPSATDRVLDVGCGPGLVARTLAPRVRSFVGVDVTPAMIERARALAAGAGLSNAEFVVGDAVALSFEAASFDVVVTRLALHHMPDPGAVLSEVARVLRPGGRLVVLDMITSEVAEQAVDHNQLERLRDPSHVRGLPLSELVRLIGAMDLDLIGIERIEYEFDVLDWLARAEQTEDARREALEHLLRSMDNPTFLGRRVRRDETGRLRYRASWAITRATKPW
jgi:SAM-dependent methyltransferase